MPGALRAACHADVCAQAAELHGIRAVARHVGGRQAANRRAVHVKANAFDHHLDVVLAQTRACAVVASVGAGVAGFDTCLIPPRDHGRLSSRVRNSGAQCHEPLWPRPFAVAGPASTNKVNVHCSLIAPTSMSALAISERTDRHVIPVRVSQRELHGSCAGVHVGLLFEARDESPCPWHGHVEIVDTEKQK